MPEGYHKPALFIVEIARGSAAFAERGGAVGPSAQQCGFE
jgi:hypothetical protein